MTGTVVVYLPVKSYLKKFLTKKYGTSYKISACSLLGIFLIEMLDKQYRKVNKKIRNVDHYQFIIPKSIVERVGFDMPTGKMFRFEEMLQKLFKNELYSYIEITVDSTLYINVNDKIYKQDIMKAIKQFLQFYNISEDEQKLESLYRDYNRNHFEVRQKLVS